MADEEHLSQAIQKTGGDGVKLRREVLRIELPGFAVRFVQYIAIVDAECGDVTDIGKL